MIKGTFPVIFLVLYGFIIKEGGEFVHTGMKKEQSPCDSYFLRLKYMKRLRRYVKKKGRVTQMKCPYCNEADTKVIDSRPADDNSSIRRRRQCERCGKRFTTYEKLETMPLMVIKKDNSRETYDRSKIEAGIIHSCHKRPVSPQQINSMIDEIENQIFNMEEKEVPTSAIGELVMGKLKDLDEVAYVRFASVYREFKDVNTFIDEIGKLLKK